MSVRIRLLEPGDEPALVAYLAVGDRFEEGAADGSSTAADHPSPGPAASRPPPGREAAFLADPSVRIWLAEDGDQPVGMLQGYLLRRLDGGPEHELLLYEIGVDVERRRAGIGRALLDAMASWMRAHGVEEVWVPAEHHAVAFYDRCGFTSDDGLVLSRSVRPARP